MGIRKIFIVAVIALLSIIPVFGDFPADPNDRIYQYLDLWEGKGLILNLPPLRPYPIQYLLELFGEVAARGGEEGKIAREYMEILSPQFSIQPSPGHTSRFTPDSYYGETGAEFPFIGNLTPLVSYTGRASVWLLDDEQGNLLPYGGMSKRDYLTDWSDIDLFGRNLAVQQSLALSTAVGTSSVYLNIGLMRGSFGPFTTNGLVLGPQAPHTGQFNFTWRMKKSVFTVATLALTATTNNGEGRYPSKYLALHSLNLFPLPWLEVGVFESVVYGGRFEPLYIIPFSEFFYFQGIIGFPDNSLIGTSVTIRFLRDFKYALMLYADDLHFNDMARLDFDTKYKVAFQTGLFWTPLYKLLKSVKLDYTLVTPYTYAHIQTSGTVNYQNYTHAGESLGPALEPNSDRIELEALFTPYKWVDVTLSAGLIRHGNASDGYTDGDGSIFDPGYDDEGNPTFQDSTRFLSQEILEYNMQCGIGTVTRVPVGKGRLTFEAGYVLEYIWNKDFEPGEEIRNIVTLGVEYAF